MTLHKTVLDSLEYVVRKSDYESVVREKTFPEASLLEGRFRHPVLQPDLRAKLKGRHVYDIYQVWDDSETYERAAYEIMRAATTPNIKSLSIVVVKKGSDSWDSNYAKLFTKGVFELLDPSHVKIDRKEVYYAEIDSKLAKNLGEIRRVLKRKLGL